MTEKELSKYYWIKKEIEDIEKKLDELGYGQTIPQISEMPKNPSNNHKPLEKLIEKRSELINMYLDKRVSTLEEYIKIEKYIDTVEEPEIRLIMRHRYLDLMQWEEIGNLLHSDRTTISKKLRRYLSENQVSHNSHEKEI